MFSPLVSSGAVAKTCQQLAVELVSDSCSNGTSCTGPVLRTNCNGCCNQL